MIVVKSAQATRTATGSRRERARARVFTIGTPLSALPAGLADGLGRTNALRADHRSIRPCRACEGPAVVPPSAVTGRRRFGHAESNNRSDPRHITAPLCDPRHGWGRASGHGPGPAVPCVSCRRRRRRSRGRGSPERAGRVVPAHRELLGAHARGVGDALRGTPSPLRRPPGGHRAAPGARSALPAAAGVRAVRPGAPSLGRRPAPEPPLPRPRHRPARPGLGAPADGPGRPRVLQQLDRDKPLWEIWIVEGLEDDRFALLAKTHHALVDGVSGIDIVSVLFDASPNPSAPPDGGQRWLPRPLPSGTQLLGEALLERATAPAEVARTVRAVFRVRAGC